MFPKIPRDLVLGTVLFRSEVNFPNGTNAMICLNYIVLLVLYVLHVLRVLRIATAEEVGSY